jgi:polyribonucleotide 5'-hydroxyl-kinase
VLYYALLCYNDYQLTITMAFRPPTPRVVQVPPLHELRIELEKGESCSIKLLGGTAEIFGFELSPGFENPLAEECKAAIFTWTGCDLEISLRSGC